MALMSSCNSGSVNSLLRCAALQKGIDFSERFYSLRNCPLPGHKSHPPPANSLGQCKSVSAEYLGVDTVIMHSVDLPALCEKESENLFSSGLPWSWPCRNASPPILHTPTHLISSLISTPADKDLLKCNGFLSGRLLESDIFSPSSPVFI